MESAAFTDQALHPDPRAHRLFREDQTAAELMREDESSMYERQEKASEAARNEQASAQVDQLKQMVDQLKATLDGKKVLGIEKVRDKSGRLITGRVRRADGSMEDVTIQ